MESIENININNKKEMLHRLVSVATSNALDFNEYEVLTREFESLNNKTKPSDEEIAKIEDMRSKINSASVHLNNLIDFKLAMEDFGLSKDNIIDFLEHENAHANVAEQLGHEFKYILTILNKNGKLIGQPAIVLEYDKNKKNDLKSIVNAPEKYGNRLSPGDEKYLNKIHE